MKLKNTRGILKPRGNYVLGSNKKIFKNMRTNPLFITEYVYNRRPTRGFQYVLIRFRIF